MRSTDIMVVLRKPADASLVEEVGAAAGWRQVLTHVVGEPGAPTPNQLRRVRRSPDSRKRRLPLLVWVSSAEDEEIWRAAGAYVVRGAITKSSAERALKEILRGDVQWIETVSYVGPCRRQKTQWLGRKHRRLADGAAAGKVNLTTPDPTSHMTLMRQLRLSAFGFEKADRDRRAQFLADIRRTRAAADRARMTHVVNALDSLARYVAACGATGRVDEMLVERHLDIAEGPAVDAPLALARAVQSVDAAIGLGQIA